MRWSCLLNALLHWLQWYFLSSLWVRRCLASAEALLKVLEQVAHAWGLDFPLPPDFRCEDDGALLPDAFC